MPKVSLIIPCYNEEKNIKPLFEQVKKLQKKIDLELIVVNNGSVDKTEKEINIFKKKIKNIKVVKVMKNIGFGNGVKKGLKRSTADIICYTHGDLQIKMNNILIAYKIYKSQKKKNIFIKGLRVNRSFFDNFFTLAMSIFNSLIFRKSLFDIHAQPNLFHKSMLNNIDNLPDNMILDLYIFLSAKIKKYEVFRFKVKFLTRKYGAGSNDSLAKKIKYSLLSILSSLRILFNGNF